MPNKHPFRAMKRDVALVGAQTTMLLGLNTVAWTQEDYANYFVLGQMYEVTKSPSYTQMLNMVLAMLRMLARLIEKVPVDSELRAAVMVEWGKIAASYEDELMQVQEAKVE